MKKSQSSLAKHFGSPKDTPFIDHNFVVEETDNVHRYKMTCQQCGTYVKWATELEYLWSLTRPKPPTFRNLYWAPEYCKEFRIISNELTRERSQPEYQGHGYWWEQGQRLQQQMNPAQGESQ